MTFMGLAKINYNAWNFNDGLRFLSVSQIR